MEWREVVLAFLVGLVAGILTSGAAGFYFLRKSSNELRNEAERLRRLIHIILLALDQARMADLARDAEGNVTGLVVHLSGTARGSALVSGTLTTEQPGGVRE